MTEWATASEFRVWSDLPKVIESDDGTLARVLKRARLNIISVCRQEPTVGESVLEALYIVAERILLGRDQAVLATSARGLSSAQFGDHSISFGMGTTQNPFITQEVMQLLAEYISPYAAAKGPLDTDKMIVRGDYEYDTDEDVDYAYGEYVSGERPYYPTIP